MIKIKHLLKVSSVWASSVYVVCYTGVAIYPPIRNLYIKYSLHADVAFKSDFFGLGYFIAGLVVWNITVVAGVWFFAFLFNKIKQ